MTADIRVYLDPRLKNLAIKAAEEKNLPLSEFVARILAKSLGHPELGIIPRGRPGRKPTPAEV